MSRIRMLLGGCLLVTGCLLATGCSAPSAMAQSQPVLDEAQRARLEAFHQAGPQASLTIYPARVLEKPDALVADVIGLVLEGYGMNRLETADAAFVPPAGTDWPDSASQFGPFVHAAKLPTDYALYAEYLGTPATGPSEVRFVIVDKQGGAVLVDRQTPADKDFRRTAARDPDPMGCTLLLAERLKPHLGLKPGAAKGGKFAQRWAQRSGTPDDAEVARMEQRRARFIAAVEKASTSVFATRVGPTTDAESGRRLADSIRKEFGGSVRFDPRELAFEIAPSSNEQKRLWDLARGLQARLRASPAETDYALLAEYGVHPQGGPAGYVHWVLCEKNGDWVVVDFQNNQWPDFQRIGPKTVEDCDRLTLIRLEARLR